MMKIAFTIFQISWAYIWASKHLNIRSERRYAEGRKLACRNQSYKAISFAVYLAQNAVCISCFWSNANFLFKFHDSNVVRFFGAAVIAAATGLYFTSLRYLGRNYSPCYDSHEPYEIIKNGPYKFVRHPMCLAKLLLVFGTFLISGSLLFIPVFLWLLVEVVRSIKNEEAYLVASVPGYSEYRRATGQVIPIISHIQRI
jgi:protein-S-isoprenylcysteine O-methyltransferase Ste14